MKKDERLRREERERERAWDVDNVEKATVMDCLADILETATCCPENILFFFLFSLLGLSPEEIAVLKAKFKCIAETMDSPASYEFVSSLFFFVLA